MNHVKIRILRWVAWIGLGLVLAVDFILSMRAPGGLGPGLFVFAALLLAVGLSSALLMPRTAGALLMNSDLLVPVILMVVAGKLIGWLAAAPVLTLLLTPSLSLNLLGLQIGLSLSFLLHVALAVVHATWTTGTLLEFDRTGNTDPCRILPLIPKRCWRVTGVMFIGWAVVMAGMSVLILMMPVLMFLSIGLMAVGGVLWNFSTAAVLPVALDAGDGFWRSFRSGIITSLAGLGGWWMLVLVQMLLLGLVIFIYTSNGGGSNTSWSINVFWTGGFENDCRWYAKMAETFHCPKLPFVETLLALLFSVFAVAIKLTIVQRLQSRPPAAQPGLSQSS
jgi:hypothetical protein